MRRAAWPFSSVALLASQGCVWLFLCLFTYLNYDHRDYMQNWSTVTGRLGLALLAQQLITMKILRVCLTDFRLWFIGFSYLFMFGQIFLDGVLGIKEIESLGRLRPVIDARYDRELLYHSALFVLCCIQSCFIGMLAPFRGENRAESPLQTEAVNPAMCTTGLLVLLLAVPCRLVTDYSMIQQAGAAGYFGLQSSVGLVDDFAFFIIPGLLYLMFSGRLPKPTVQAVLLVAVGYCIAVMILTGDRRYQSLVILVLVLAYLRLYDVRFSFKQLWLGLGGLVLLNLFNILRNIRESDLQSLSGFMVNYGGDLLAASVVQQTLYEFGGSVYTVCLALQYIPGYFDFRYGATLLSGAMCLIPLGVLYADGELYQYGKIAHQLTELGQTTVGASVYGDLYANFGWVSIIMAYWLGRVFFKLFKHDINPNRRYYLAQQFGLFYVLINLVRASFTEGIRASIWGYFFPLLILTVILRRSKLTGDQQGGS